MKGEIGESSDYKELSEEKKLFNSLNVEIKNINNINKIQQNSEKVILRNSIRLLTYNFFCRPPPINSNDGDYKDARLNDFLEQLQNFDIICFQELFTTLNDRKHKMIREGAKVGLRFYASPRVPSFFSKYLTDSGLLILSRYPILENEFYEYFINVSGDAPSNKGVLYAKIKINDNFLFLFNTHLQSTYYDESQKKIDCTIQVRTTQTEELINFVFNKLIALPKEEINNGCIIIAGDFNIDAHDNKFAKTKYKIPNYNISEYNLLKLKFQKLGTAIDLMEKKYNEHLYTYGDNEKEEYDHTLTSKIERNMKQTLDYIWEIIPNFNNEIYKEGYNMINDSYSFEDKNNDNKIKVLYDSFKVQEFLVKNRPYQQLSDHFGVSVDLYSPQNISQTLKGSFNNQGEIEEPLKSY